MVKILLGNITSKIIGYLPAEVHEQLDNTLSYRIKDYHYNALVKSKKWDGVYRLYRKNFGQSFYSGLLSLVEEVLKINKIQFVRSDERIKPEQNLPNLCFNPPPWHEDRDYQNLTIERSVNSSRGILKIATGGGKCLGKGTPILMFDGSIKPVENILVGDLLMGPDSTSRKVSSICNGYGRLFNVKQKNGQDYVCNDAHILCLQRTSSTKRKWGRKTKEEIEITASDFYNQKKWRKHIYKGFKVGVEFNSKKVPIDPYWLGLWLGDGNKNSPAITTGDKEIASFLKFFAKENGLYLRESLGRGCSTYYFVQNRNRKNKGKGLLKNHLLDKLRNILVVNNKHIPPIYKYNDRSVRLSILAGLIDSDGTAKRKGSIEFYNTNIRLAEDVCFLARSLGFRATISTKKDQIKSINYSGISYRVLIGGNIADIPIRVKRKRVGNKEKYSALRYGISLTPIEDGMYYGFEIDKDGRFLLGDFTVTHNTVIISKLISELKTYPFMFYVLTEDLMQQAYEVLSGSLNEPIGRIGGGEFDIQKINICTIQTAILSLNAGNAKFNIDDYKFDEDDSAWSDAQLLNVEKLEKLKKLISLTKGLYFDETHHAAAKTCKDVLTASPNCFWRYGGSATPYREDGAEIMIQAMFGKKIVDISASYLIKNNYLVEPYIIFEPIKHQCKFHSYAAIYKDCVVGNKEFNTHVAEIANHLVSKGLSTLILVKQYSQGEFIKKLVPNTEFLTSKLSKEKRKSVIQDLRDRKTLCLIATTLADEGLDIPTLDAALLAGGGASSTRVHQRIGRTLRKEKKANSLKDRSIVVYFEHEGAKYLDKHAKKARKIIKTEPKFNIIDSAGPNFIKSEIDQIMYRGGNKPESVFSI